jgi:plasmid maintenance system antidote protein VapI
MAVVDDRETKRRPSHQGEILSEDYPPELNQPATGMAGANGVSRQPANE